MPTGRAETHLPFSHLPIKLGETEQGGAHALIPYLRGLTLRVEALITHEAGPAADGEREHDAVAGLDVGDLRADLFHDAHGLVAEDVTPPMNGPSTS